MKLKLMIITQVIMALLLFPINTAFADDTVKDFTLSIGETNISIGSSAQQVVESLGNPKRIDPSPFDFDWHVYNANYNRFIMVGIGNGVVKGIYTSSKGFKSDVASYGDIGKKSADPDVRIYSDVNNGNRVHAILVTTSKEKNMSSYSEAFCKAQELEAFDATNAFRANNGLSTLKYNYMTSVAAKKHSSDMANNNYFSHISPKGSSPVDRYRKISGNTKAYGSFSGENLSAGRMIGLEAFNDWVNSSQHRKNMLAKHSTMGNGYIQNSSSHYKFYITQMFTK